MKELLKKQAILDIIVTPQHEYWLRLVSYVYDDEKQCDIFKIDTGSGDHLYAVFAKEGAILKGFDHESCLSPYQNETLPEDADPYAQLPAQLLPLLDESIEKDDVTFCLWQLPTESAWHRTTPVLLDRCLQSDGQQPDDGGEAHLTGYIFSNAQEWYDWASIYYELQEEAWDAAELLYETGEITRSMVMDLNPDRDYDTIMDECLVSGLL